MGVIMSFTRVSAVELERLTATPEWPDDFLDGVGWEDDGPDGYLDKAWAGLGFLMLQANLGVSLFDGGRPLPDENYFAWTPEDVAAASRVLSRFPFDELALFFDPVLMDGAGIYPNIWVRDGRDGLEYLRHHYVGLEQVFRYAAERGSGFLQHFG
ncbi:YfbM family protein [Nocardia sp. AG03]|uniref:YfbM family protein n=1 Tax=Nocardia sp. AG03 TaxID=3025312 RepID=UPI00241846CD|nr:YfbM family protein [Nocardia sp. AG03]